MILGTAGHIDHGKTALVKALTGIDTDRLPEERRRGITIELGFAPLRLPGVGVLGVVDVPGHEAFIRTMLAGATGIDLALLVVAADEGVMPQTREHLAILDLLGIRGGVIALTKTDLVEAEWLALVGGDVALLTAGTALEGAPVIPVSARTGSGLDALREALARAAQSVPDRNADDLFRLPVDRVFTVKGTGTVVAGTVWTGHLRHDDVVRILPGGGTARVRGLQSHGASIDAAGPGMRVAISLGGVELTDVPRGSTLVTTAAWEPTSVLRADVQLLEHVPALDPPTQVRVHLGTSDVGGRVVAAGGGVRPGTVTPVRIILETPLVARGGDRFVLRAGSPSRTLGGGVITDPQPGRRRIKPWPNPDPTIAERLQLMAQEAGSHGIARSALDVRLGLRQIDIDSAISSVGDLVVIAGTLFDRTAVDRVRSAVLRAVDTHHTREPLSEGASLQAVRSAIVANPELIDEQVRRLASGRSITIERGLVCRSGWTPKPSTAQEAALERLVAAIRAAGRAPPSVSELAAAGVITKEDDGVTLLRLLDRRGIVRQVEPDRFYSIEALGALTGALRGAMVQEREYGPGELRELLGVSRKYLIPLLEYYDRAGVTERRPGGRVLRTAGRGGVWAGDETAAAHGASIQVER